MLKSKWNTVKKWTAENKEVIAQMAIGTAVVVGAAVIMSNKRKETKPVLELEDKGEDESTYVFSERILYQLEDTNEDWCLITSETGRDGKPIDLAEIGRQIAEGEYGED